MNISDRITSGLDTVVKGALIGMGVGAALGLASSVVKSRTFGNHSLEAEGFQFLAMDETAITNLKPLAEFRKDAPQEFRQVQAIMNDIVAIVFEVMDPDKPLRAAHAYSCTRLNDELQEAVLTFGKAVKEKLNPETAGSLRFQEFADALQKVMEWGADAENNVNVEVHIRMKNDTSVADVVETASNRKK